MERQVNAKVHNLAEQKLWVPVRGSLHLAHDVQLSTTTFQGILDGKKNSWKRHSEHPTWTQTWQGYWNDRTRSSEKLITVLRTLTGGGIMEGHTGNTSREMEIVRKF